MTTNSANPDHTQLWLKAWHRLHLSDARALVFRAEIDHLLERMPERRDDQTCASWLGQIRTAQVIAFPGKVGRFKPMTEFYRMAADSGTERFPLPETTLESADGRLWLSVGKDGDELTITIQAVGMAVDDLSGKTVGLASADDPDTLLISVELDEQAEGICRVSDSDAIRRGLLHPVIGIVDSGDA